MKAVGKFLVCLGFVGLGLGTLAFGSAANIYITQSGSPSGNCSSGVQTPAFFNNAANWGGGAGQIGPGTIVHLCGTFTAAAGSNGYLTFQASGTSAAPVELLFESGATLTAPYWTNAIVSNNLSNLLIDGGTNGTIIATANGTGLANQQAGTAVNISGGSGIEIRNLTISNMYIHTGSWRRRGEHQRDPPAICAELQYPQQLDQRRPQCHSLLLCQRRRWKRLQQHHGECSVAPFISVAVRWCTRRK